MHHSIPRGTSPRALLCIVVVCLSALVISHATPAKTPREDKPVEIVGSADLPVELSPEARAQERPPVKSPMMLAIDEALLGEGVAVAALEARLEKSTDESETLHLMREVEQVRRETELSVLRIQAAFAREGGQLEKARRIDSILERMQRVYDALYPKSQGAQQPEATP